MGAVTITESVSAAALIEGAVNTGDTGWLSDFTQGFDFTANDNLTLTSLGFWDSNSDGFGGGSFQVGLWQTATQNLLGDVTVNGISTLDTSVTITNGRGISGQYRYQDLTTPINLTSGTNYTLGFFTGSSGLLAEDALALSDTLADTTFNSNITRGTARRFRSGASLSFPTGTTSALPLGQVNARFGSAPVTTPEPSATVGIIALGLLGLGSIKGKK